MRPLIVRAGRGRRKARWDKECEFCTGAATFLFAFSSQFGMLRKSFGINLASVAQPGDDLGRAHNSAVECHLHTVEVVGSNPAVPTIKSIT